MRVSPERYLLFYLVAWTANPAIVVILAANLFPSQPHPSSPTPRHGRVVLSPVACTLYFRTSPRLATASPAQPGTRPAHREGRSANRERTLNNFTVDNTNFSPSGCEPCTGEVIRYCTKYDSEKEVLHSGDRPHVISGRPVSRHGAPPRHARGG